MSETILELCKRVPQLGTKLSSLELEQEEMKGEAREALRRINCLEEIAGELESENKELREMVIELSEKINELNSMVQKELVEGMKGIGKGRDRACRK